MDKLIKRADDHFNKKEYGYLMSVLEHLKDPLEKSDEFTIQVPYDKEGKEDNSFCTVCKKCLTLDTCQLDKQRLDYIFYNPNNSKLKYKTSKILPLNINRQDIDFVSLSDHAGIYVEFTY